MADYFEKMEKRLKGIQGEMLFALSPNDYKAILNFIRKEVQRGLNEMLDRIGFNWFNDHNDLQGISLFLCAEKYIEIKKHFDLEAE